MFNLIPIKLKDLSLSTAFSIFIVMISLMFSIAVTGVVYYKIDSLVRENRHNFIKQEMLGIGLELERYLFLKHKAVQNYAKSPLLTQTVMHPETNTPNITDFFSDLGILGNIFPLTLSDYLGRVIYSTKSTVLIPKKIEPQPSPINFSILLDAHSQSPIVSIVAPVLYLNSIEGYLTAHIPLTQIITDLKIHLHTKQHRIQIKSGHTIFADLGAKTHETTHSINIPSLNITINYNTGKKTLQNTKSNLLLSIFFWLFVISIIISIISNRLGHALLINPLKKLQQVTKDLADGKKISMAPSINHFIEINNLEKNLNFMADQIFRRERTLNKARDTLQELNDRLVEHHQQLLHSEKLASVGQLAAGVAHEINNPTAFVMGNLEVLSEYKDDILGLLTMYQDLENKIKDNDHKNIIDTLKSIQKYKSECNLNHTLTDMSNLITDSIDGSRRIKNIVKDLKNFSRVNSIKKELVNINEDVIETALRLVWNELKYKCILKKSLSNLPKYLCNPGELSQVILNLLVNAGDAIKESGEISISSEFMNNYIKIKISDNGEGINDKDIMKLFDPFFTTKEIGKGTGLGLSISHSIIKKHGGVLSVESQLTIGTVFTVTLPIVDK